MPVPMNPLTKVEKAFDMVASEYLDPKFIPTGIQEELIKAVGESENTITVIYISAANKIGKTATGCNIMKNIVLQNDKDWFGYKNFDYWEYPKRGRIVGTHTNIAESGIIQQEIKRWIPRKRYQSSKAGKPYDSQYTFPGGWAFDVMTYNQDPDEFEGQLLGFQWLDEPPKVKLMGAIMSRFSKGGILLVTATPVGNNVGPFLDYLDDLETKQSDKIKVIRLYGNIYENSVTKGKPNSRGTKCGLMTDDEIEAYVAGIPRDEADARIYGKPSHKAGKIYPMFEYNANVKAWDFQHIMKYGNLYMSLDPHQKYYHFAQFWAILPGPHYVCYNEWPTVDMLNSYYDEIRNSLSCPYKIGQMAEFLKTLSGINYGAKMKEWLVDPYYAKGLGGSDFAKKTQGIIMEFSQYGIELRLPPREKIDVQRNRIQELLSYDTQRPMNQFNEPMISIMPHCRNTIRAFERHYWDERKEVESEDYKDPMDCARNFFAWIDGVGYQGTDNDIENKIIPFKKEEEPELVGCMSDIGLM